MPGKVDAYIVDIDGTVALHTPESRGHFEYAKVSEDLPNWPVINIVQYITYGFTADFWLPRLQPVFMSGRADEADGQVRKDTVEWIFRNMGISREYFNGEDDQQDYIGRLFMRPEYKADGSRDFRPDDIVKEELYTKYVEPHFNIHFAIDDRPRVLRMWQRLGIPTLAVGTPWIEF